jgi:hypothetical protein
MVITTAKSISDKALVVKARTSPHVSAGQQDTLTLDNRARSIHRSILALPFLQSLPFFPSIALPLSHRRVETITNYSCQLTPGCDSGLTCRNGNP